MAYKAISYTDSKALGAKVANDVLCKFNVNEDASKSMRIEVITADSETAAVILQHSMDEVTWTTAKTSGETGTMHTIYINLTDTSIIPLKPCCRLLANATMTVTKVQVAKNN